MMLPGVITVSVPVVVKFALGNEALGGLLVGATLLVFSCAHDGKWWWRMG